VFNNRKQFAPIDDKDLKAVIQFYRNRARDFQNYATGLESGEESDRMKDVIEKFQHQIRWSRRWIKFLMEG
jgi:hypothetical protein